MVVVKPLWTPADFERMLASGELPDVDDVVYELVDGEVMRLPQPEWYHAAVGAAVIAALSPFGRSIGALVLGDNAAFTVGEHRQQVRSPDVSLVTKQRMRILQRGRRLGSEAPDLAVEILSSQQHGESYARHKVPEYLAAGAKVVWLIDAEAKTVRSYEAGRAEYAIYSEAAEINLDAIAAGFSASVTSFFPATE
jgi:Uma2 family endonuclease